EFIWVITIFGGAVRCFLQNCLMTQMNSVEVPDGQHTAAPGRLVELAPFLRRSEHRQSVQARNDESGILNYRRWRVGGEFQLQSVVSQLNICVALITQTLVGRGVSKVMRDVCKPRAL